VKKDHSLHFRCERSFWCTFFWVLGLRYPWITKKTTIGIFNWFHLSKLESTMDTKWSGWDHFHLLWKVWSCIDTHWGNECNNYCKLKWMVGFELAKEKASSNGMVGLCWLLMALTNVIIHVSFVFALGVVVLKCNISH